MDYLVLHGHRGGYRRAQHQQLPVHLGCDAPHELEDLDGLATSFVQVGDREKNLHGAFSEGNNELADPALPEDPPFANRDRPSGTGNLRTTSSGRVRLLRFLGGGRGS